MKDIYDIVRVVRSRPGQAFALATLVQTEGSSYRRPGARMLVCTDGVTIGSLSGGCLEEEVAAEARAVLANSIPKLISFDTRRRFGCNGRIEIFIERIEETLLKDISSRLERRAACTMATVFRHSSVGEAASFPGTSLGSRIISAKEREAGSFPYRDHGSCENVSFVQEIRPPLRLLLFGDGPDSHPIRQLCDILGWMVVDAPDATLAVVADAWTAALVKSHNYGRDFAALQKLLPLHLRYVGLIGPRKRRDQLLHDLLEVGVSINAGFFAPAGLDLAGETPEEIALAVMSEMQHVFAGGTGVSLRERKSPIHIARSHAVTVCEAPLP
jgi:xanthine/CO dehydrogenase XdhC/CoxF family maturation factor